MTKIGRKLRNIRKTRTEVSKSKSKNFEEYRPAYEEILREVKSCGGSEPMEAVCEWIDTAIKDTKKLPTPRMVRQQALHICEDRDVTVPENSPLRTEK